MTLVPCENLVPYDQLRDLVRNGDLLLWHPTSIMGRAICLGSSIAQRQWVRYSHASMAAWGKNRRLYNLEMVQFHGGRHFPLSAQVARYPRSCEIWRPVNAAFDGDGAVEQMLWLMGQHYGWADFARITVRGLCPNIVLPEAVNTDDPDEPRVCSAAYHWAARTGGGIAPCFMDVLDLEVTPGDLAFSGFAEYVATPII